MKLALTAITTVIALSGCSSLYQPYPQAQHPARADQEKIQAAEHWNVIAKHESKLIAETLGTGASAAVSPKKNNAPFDRAYKNLLTQHLLNDGVAVSSNPSTAQFTIDYETQVIVHKGRDSMQLPAGTLTATAASIWLIGHAANNWSEPGLAAIPFILAGDAYLANNRNANTPNTEVLITTNVRYGDRLAESSTRIYYFNPGDISLYTTKAGSKTFTVSDQH